MKKLILTLGLAESAGIAEDVELKECKNKQDKISGCVTKCGMVGMENSG